MTPHPNPLLQGEGASPLLPQGEGGMRDHDNNSHRRKTPHPNPLLRGEGAVTFSPQGEGGDEGF